MNSSDFRFRDPHDIRNIITVAPQAFLFWNLGLWLSTTDWATRHRLWSAFVMLPAPASAVLLGFPFSYESWVVAAIIVWSFTMVIIKEKDK
jgi:hypothetical protein